MIFVSWLSFNISQMNRKIIKVLKCYAFNKIILRRLRITCKNLLTIAVFISVTKDENKHKAC